MNKSALKTFATEARIELLEKIELQARKLGITAISIEKANVESSDAIFIDGKQLSDTERTQRNQLIARINEIGFDHVIEETAYTWFNRFIALRYMEVNDYLPTKVRVLSSRSGSAEPDMMQEALSLNLDLDKEKVYEMKMNNEADELFKYLIKLHCNDLNRYMPFMFETIEDYTEILFPEGLLGMDSFVRQMTDTEVIPEDNWTKVEIIGWLYQYYISEEKDYVFANLKKNIKITKDTLPAATQLFTPNWIVRYMVENSLGRIWLESYPESQIKSEWKYYLQEAEQEDEVLRQLEEIRYKNVNPEEITFLDPCCGSGHILVYAFDVFYDLYLEKGYMENEIPKLILEKNLFGLDIDNRAVQLASFAVMMKAREKSRRVFRQEINPNIYMVEESNWLTDEMIKSIANNNDLVQSNLNSIKSSLLDAKEYGTLLSVKPFEFENIEQSYQAYIEEEANLLEVIDKQIVGERLPRLLKFASLLNKKYDVVCTNPPYLGRSRMNPKLTRYLNKNYPDAKSDLFATFIEKGFELLKESGFNSMVTMQSWMFLSSYEKMRKKILDQKTISTLLHMDNMVMGIAFGTSATIYRNIKIPNYNGIYTEVTYKDVQSETEPNEFPIRGNRNGVVPVENFGKIPGSPIAYWASTNLVRNFETGIKMSDILDAKQGLATANNDRFLRFWWEPEISKIKFDTKSTVESKTSGFKWVPYNKGGERRQWYGNYDYVVNWENDGEEIRNFTDDKGKLRSVIRSPNYYFKEGITWSLITSGGFSIRYRNSGSIHDVSGMSAFTKNNETNILTYILGVMSTNIANYIFKMLNPTINLQIGDFNNFPIIIKNDVKTKVEELVNENIKISKVEWNNYEVSWDFKEDPLIRFRQVNLEESYKSFKQYENSLFDQLKENENELNRLFIEVYNLQEELTPEVSDRDITIAKVFDSIEEIPEQIQGNSYILLKEDIVKQLLSYFIGCNFGRYSIDEKGIVYTGGEFDSSRYRSFPVDEDNILPVLSGSYFEDDIVARFVEFIKVTFSKDTLEENLDFVADAIGRRKNETARETLRRYFLNDFYKDHVKTYKKRPIYWLFTSGKEKAFNCLIYMHRYDKTTLSRIRTGYLHEVQTRMDAEKNDLLEIINGDATTREINNAKKELKILDRKIDELVKYDELLHHMADMQIDIDLDDGVKVNYEKFKGLVAKI